MSDTPLIPRGVMIGIVVVAAVVIAWTATPMGSNAIGDLQRLLSYYVGVFTLLTLTGAVVTGCLATERVVMGIRARVLVQAAHRALTTLSFACVVTHFTIKILQGSALPAQVVIPYAGPVGYGTVAFDCMIILAVTGVLRARFADRKRVWTWRLMHSVAYIAFPFAIAHGLTAGRQAANYVNLSYIFCAGLVALAVVTRLFMTFRPRRSTNLLPDPMYAPQNSAIGNGAAMTAAQQAEMRARTEVRQ